MTTFIAQALVFLSASVILVPICQKLGFGSVLGYLIAGVLVGPHGFKIIQDAESIVHFSEFGVVFLLFIIGLEIQPRKLWMMRRHLLGLGGLQVLLCTLIFMGIGVTFGFSPVVSGVIGFALSLSSTAFAIQTLVEKNLFNTEFGRGSFSILLMQDLLAIPALAIIPMLAPTETSFAIPWRNLIVGLFVIGGLVAFSRYLTRPLFRMIASTRSRDNFTAVALFLVIGVAMLMQQIGLSAALGTFIAGVLLADSEYRHELETNLEPFRGLLMGLFFIAVGMSVSIELIANQPFLMLACAFAYLLVKALVVYVLGRIFDLNHSNAKLMALSIAQGGEFAFVIFGIAAEFSLVSSTTLTFLTAIITLSMLLGPFVNLFDVKLSRVLKQKNLEPNYDEIKDDAPQVIVAGCGRFGQIFTRILRAQNIPFVAIDHDSTQIELLRKFGSIVYYGDASRKDLLATAGAARAKYFILAIDDVEMSIQTASVVKEHFPNLTIFARARNRGHAFDLMAMGIKFIKRETFDSSVYFVRDLLNDMGFETAKTARLIERFREHDEIMLHEQFKVRTDDKSMVSLSKQASAQLGQVLKDDNLQSHINL